MGRYEFAPPLLALRPGERRSSRLTVRGPAPIVVGRDREMALKVRGHANDEVTTSADATYRRRPWLPWWAIALLAALIALLILLLV